MRLSLLAWTVETDCETTEVTYHGVAEGASERCGCLACRNFCAARPVHYCEGFLRLLASLRIDPSKEFAVRLVSPLEGHRHLYTGTYGFSGEILSGRPFRGFPLALEEVDVFERVGLDAHVALRPWIAPPAPWAEGLSVRLDFLVVLPWVLEEGEAPLVNLDRGPRGLTS